MSASPQHRLEELEAQVAELRARLADTEQTLDAIRSGAVDALVIDTPEGQRIFSLTGAERPYRTLIEQMSEGAATLGTDGSIRYCNKAFAAMLQRPLETLTGGGITQYVPAADQPVFTALLHKARSAGAQGEIGLCAMDGGVVPVYVSLTLLVDAGLESICMVVTNLTERKQAARISSNEQFVQRLIESAPIGIAVVDERLRYVLANPVYRALAGTQLVTGRDMAEVFASPILRVVEPLVRQVLKTGESLNLPECALPDGAEGWWNVSLVPLREPAGSISSILILTEDISERKAAILREAQVLERNLTEQQRWHAKLQASEDRLQTGLASAQAGVFDWDVISGDVVWTDGHYTLLGLEPRTQSAGYELWRRHVHPDDWGYVEAAMQRAIATGERFAADYRVVGADGSERWVQGQGLLIARAGESKRMIGAIVDITARKKAEEELRRSQEALKEADRRKDEFLATLAHELRNPLAPIRTAAHLLLSPKLTPQQLHWAQTLIQRQTGHMALLLDDLLDISRITQGKLFLKKERVKLTDVVDAAVEASRPFIDSKNHSFTVSLPAETVLDADPLRLSQILSNLLTNAAKYTDPAGHIELFGVAETDTLILSVKDDGIGLPSNMLNRIFDMFSQVDDSSQRSDGGLGIGLALVKGLVDLHGGTIEAKSAGPAQGSVFTVRLPLTSGEPVAVGGNADKSSPSLIARRVLVADDNKDAADALAALLELDNHEVRVAHSGRAALTLAQTFRPDVALLDIGMPELSGYEVAHALRQEPWGANILLIALTGWGQDDDRQRAKQAGFDRHMTKPIDPDELEALLQPIPRPHPA